MERFKEHEGTLLLSSHQMWKC